MKKLMMIVGILLLAGLVALPVMAWGPGWGRGHHMMGYRDSDPDYGREYATLTPEQRSQLKALDQKFYSETRELRHQIWTKFNELDAVLASPNPDLDQAKALQNEISGLRGKLDEKTLGYNIEVRKIVPDQRLGYGYGGGYGHRGGYGHHMGPYGRGMGSYSRGGHCWN
jgi:Spy/CpxP family protein refolding chaperone